jgi:hypothetical protein
LTVKILKNKNEKELSQINLEKIEKIVIFENKSKLKIKNK